MSPMLQTSQCQEELPELLELLLELLELLPEFLSSGFGNAFLLGPLPLPLPFWIRLGPADAEAASARV